MTKSWGYAALKAKEPLQPFSFARRDPGSTDLLMEIQYCGVCHSDLHMARNEWGMAIYPLVPGHEIIGRVIQVGSAVKKFKVGDVAGVGCFVDSCRTCENCRAGEEQYCNNQLVLTYASPGKDGLITYGGYSNNLIVDENYALRISPKLDPAAAAPLLCAGITTYSPLKHWKIGQGHKVGVIGLGGLGHMALKFGCSFGARVVQFTTSLSKKADALKLGADEVVLSTDPKAMLAHANSFDLIIDTVSAPHDSNAYISLLKLNGTLVMVGLPDKISELQPFNFVLKRRSLAGSAIGGIRETQEMLDYCAEHGIAADIEVIPIQKINEAYERMLKSDVKYRFVIDLASLPKE
jgi:uncharacterized zinc-type alcohol dehydrogenase-like protein